MAGDASGKAPKKRAENRENKHEKFVVKSETEVTAAGVAKVLGINQDAVRQLVESGTLEQTDAGGMILCKNIQKYIKFLSKENSIKAETEVSAGVLAKVLGIPVAQVQQMISEGMLESAPSGNIRLCQNVQKYIKSFQRGAAINADTEVSTTELAAVLGITARRVQQLIQDGAIDTVRRGTINLSDALQKYIKYLGREGTTDADLKLERDKRKAELLLKESKAHIAEMEAEELAGTMHRSEDVAAVTEDLIYTIRSSLLSLPGRLAMDVAETKTAAEASERIKREVYTVMRDLAKYQYNPQIYAERVRERKEWEGMTDEEP